MDVGNPDLLTKLSILDKDSKKKTVAELKEMKEIVATILAQDEKLDQFLRNLSREKWNPKTLELFAQGLHERLRDLPQEEAAESILSVLRANHRGVATDPAEAVGCRCAPRLLHRRGANAAG